MNENNSALWYLRTDSSSVFGPVSTETLVQWAKQARILPGHEVSTDRNSWIRAETLPELAMDTYIDLGDDRQSGPFNRIAAEALLASGKVPAGARIISNDEFSDANSDSENVTEENNETLKEESEAEETPIAPPMEKAAVEKAESPAAEQSGDIGGESGKNDYKDELNAALEQIKIADEKNATLLSELSIEREKLKNIICKYENSEAKIEELSTETAALKKELQTAGGVKSEIESKLDAAEARCRELQTELNSKQEEIAAAFEEKSGLEKKITALSETIEDNHREIDALSQKTADLEGLIAQREAKITEAEEAKKAVEAKAEEEAKKFTETEAELRKNCMLSPEAVRRFHEDRQMLYTAAKDSAEKIATSLEEEFALLEQLKQLSSQRQHLMLDNRRILMRIHDNAPSDVIKFSSSGRESEAQIIHLRAQLDNVTLTAQREKAFAESRENELIRKIHALENELAHTVENLTKEEARSARADKVEAILQEKEQELQNERHDRAEERQQFEISQTALLTRLESLEKKLFSNGV